MMIPRLLGVVIALGGLPLVLSSSLTATVSDSHPNGLGGLAKGSSAAMHRQLAAPLALVQGPATTRDDSALAARLLDKQPLDADALTYLALTAEARGDKARTRTLMELALRSDGRSLRPRLWLIDNAIRQRNYAAAIAHLDRLLATKPALQQATLNAMTGLVRDPASHAPIARMLASNPPWRANFLYALNQRGLSSDTVFRLTTQNSAQTAALNEQSTLLQTLIKNHEYERAYLAWVNFLPEASLKKVGTIFDPSFTNLPGPLPFNWQLANGSDGSAEFRRPAGLTVSYLGTAPAALATQMLFLSPGRYRLSAIASGADTYNQLSWVVTCDQGGDPLGTMQLSNLADGRRKYTALFTVPESGCEAQRLALTGSPGEFPRTAEAEIDETTIQPAT